MGHLRATALAVLVLIVFSLLGASPASAHATLIRSEPPNGGKVSIGRSTFTLWFSEPISIQASTFRLRALTGAPVAVTVSAANGSAGRLIQIHTKPLAKETYLLHWTALSLDDGHAASGSMVFGVGVRPAVVPDAKDGLPSLAELVLRWLDLVAIMLAIGALVVSGRVLRSMGASGGRPLQRARTIGALAAGAAVVSGAITPFLRVPRAGNSVGTWFNTIWVTLTATSWGNLWLAREAALVVVAVGLWAWASGRDKSGRSPTIAALALTAVVGLEALAGHAADLPRQTELAAVASALHLAAAGVWAGGLGVLALCLIPVMRAEPEARIRILATVWRTFSPIAAIATAVLIATGLYEAGRYVPDPSAVGSTVYGSVVATKSVILLLVLTAAGANTLLVNPRHAASVGRLLGRPLGWTPLASRHFVRVLSVELVLLVVAVVAAALMTSVPTSRELGASVENTAFSAANVDGLVMSFEEVPAATDRTRLIVRARTTIRPAPAPITGVEVHLVSPTGTRSVLSFAAVEPGRYEAETPSMQSGGWRAVVAVHRSGLPDAITRVAWTTTATSDAIRPLEAVTGVFAAALLLAAAAGASCLVPMGRMRPPARMQVVEETPRRQR